MRTSDPTPAGTLARPPAYQHRSGDPSADGPRAVALWGTSGFGSVAGHEADLARYAWFYLNNPQGRGRVNWLQASDGEAVGFLGLGARQLFLGREALAAGVLVDFVVSPKHRSAFPALTLQRKGREEALTSMSVVFGMPDTKAVGICKRLEMHVQFDLPRFARVILSRVYWERMVPTWLAGPLAAFTDLCDGASIRLQLLLSRVSGQWVEDFDARFDDLWQAVDKTDRCIGIRTQAFLRWRFGQQPGRGYRIFTVQRDGSDALLMYCVCEVAASTLRVKDCLSVGTPGEVQSGLLLLALAARRLRCSSIEVQVCGDESFNKGLRRAQFVLRSQRPFFAIVNEPWRKPAGTARWYITQADEDV